MALGGALLRFGQTGLRVIELLASILVLGVFSYFLAVLADHHLHIATWIRAVEGMSGAAVLYLLFAVLLTLFLGGVKFFAFIAVVLDLCFVGCFVAIAYLNRGGAGSCKGIVNTPLGSGPSNSNAAGYGKNGFGFGSGENVTYAPNLHRACKLETAVFAVSIVNIFLFLVTAALQILIARHHQKEKHNGPSPSNNYTSGAGKQPFWKRNTKNKHATRDAEMATAGTAVGAHHHNTVRPSHDTAYTGTTAEGQGANSMDQKYGEPAYGQPGYGQSNYVAPVHHSTTTATNY